MRVRVVTSSEEPPPLSVYSLAPGVVFEWYGDFFLKVKQPNRWGAANMETGVIRRFDPREDNEITLCPDVELVVNR